MFVPDIVLDDEYLTDPSLLTSHHRTKIRIINISTPDLHFFHTPLIKILSLLPAFSCCIHISFEVHPRILEIIDLLYNFSVTQIFPRNTFIDITDKFIVKSTAQTGKFIY